MKILPACLIALDGALPTAAQAGSDGRNVGCVINQQRSSPPVAGRAVSIPTAAAASPWLRRAAAAFPATVTGISVAVEEPGIAQMHGLTPTGPASCWGTAVRSRRDRACWEGPDFSVCAY